MILVVIVVIIILPWMDVSCLPEPSSASAFKQWTPAMPGKIVEKPEQRKMVRISKEALFWSSHVLFF